MSTTIATGALRDGQVFYVRYLTLNDLSVIMKLQDKVKHALFSRATLEPLSEEEFTVILSGHEFMIGVFSEEKMIAFRAMLKPELDKEHLGIDAGLQQKELPLVIYSEISNVDPNYRGNGLQTYMGKLLMERIDDKQFHYVCATVAPFNIPSLKDKLMLGMEIVALKKKYGGKLRYVLMKNLVSYHECTFTEKKLIKMQDSQMQQKLLLAGLRGVAIKSVDGEWYVAFFRVK